MFARILIPFAVAGALLSACSNFDSNPVGVIVTSQVLLNSGEVLDINTGVSEDVSTGWIAMNGTLYFIDKPTVNPGHQIWKSTAGGSASLLIDLGLQNFVTNLLVDTRTGVTPTRFYFVVNGTDLWTSDGTSTSKIATYIDGGSIVTTSLLGNDIYYQVNGTGANGQVFKSVNGAVPGEVFSSGTTSFNVGVSFVPASTHMYIYGNGAPAVVYAHSGNPGAATTVESLTAANIVTQPSVEGDDFYYQESATFKVFKSQLGAAGGEIFDDTGAAISSAVTMVPATARMYFYYNAANSKVLNHRAVPGNSALVDTTAAANTVTMAKTVGNDLYYQYSAAFNVEKSVGGGAAVEVKDDTGASFTVAVTTVAGSAHMYLFQSAPNETVYSHMAAAANATLVGALTAGASVTNPTVVTDDLYYQEDTTTKVFKSAAGATSGEVKDALGNSFAAAVSFVPGSTAEMYIHGNATGGNAMLYSHKGNPGDAIVVMDGATGLFNSGKMIAVGDNLFFQGPTAGSPTGLFDSVGGAMAVDVGGFSPSANDDYLCTAPYTPVSIGANLFFVANNGTNGCELWTTAGSAASTYMVKDVNAGYAGANPTSLTVSNARLYFVAKDSSVPASPSNTYLFFSDPPYATVTKVALTGADANPAPQYLTAVGTKLYFAADVAGMPTLFEHDATGSAAAAIKQTATGPTNLTLNVGTAPFILAVGTEAFIVAAPLGGTVYDLYLSESTQPLSENPALIKHLNASATTSSNPTLFKGGFYASTVFFSADDGGGVELWKTDGTSGGTVKIRNIDGNATAPTNASPGQLTWAGTNLYFTANDNMPGDGGAELYVTAFPWTDATKLTFRTTNPQIANLVSLGVYMIFTMSEDGSAAHSSVYRTDGTVGNTVRLLGDNPAAATGPTFNTVGNGYANGKQFFAFNPTTSVNFQLYETDGTVAGTGLVGGTTPPYLNPADQVAVADVGNFSVVAGNLVFPGNDGTTGTQLWYTDGTWTGTAMIENFTPLDNLGSSPALIGTAGSSAYYFVRDTNHGHTLYMITPN